MKTTILLNFQRKKIERIGERDFEAQILLHRKHTDIVSEPVGEQVCEPASYTNSALSFPQAVTYIRKPARGHVTGSTQMVSTTL